MKKLLALVLVLAMALSLCACGSGKVPTAEEVKGSNDGKVYENSYLGIKFTVKDAWYFLSDAEIAEIAGTTQDILSDAGNDVQDATAYYDMMAMDENTGNNINIMVQVVGNVSDVNYDEILDESEAEILQMGASIGAKYTFSEHTTVKLSGVEFHKMDAVGEMTEYGISYEQGCYIAVIDGVFVNITTTSYDGTPLTDIEAMFN